MLSLVESHTPVRLESLARNLRGSLGLAPGKLGGLLGALASLSLGGSEGIFLVLNRLGERLSLVLVCLGERGDGFFLRRIERRGRLLELFVERGAQGVGFADASLEGLRLGVGLLQELLRSLNLRPEVLRHRVSLPRALGAFLGELGLEVGHLLLSLGDGLLGLLGLGSLLHRFFQG